MNVIKHNIKEMREAATLLEQMRGVYPGDPCNSLGKDAFLLNKAASWLERIDWDKEGELFLETHPKIVVTFGNDNEKEDV